MFGGEMEQDERQAAHSEPDAEVTYVLPDEVGFVGHGSEPESKPEAKPKRSRKPKPKRSRKPKPDAEPEPTESDFALVSGGPQWARGTFVKTGIVLRFDEDGFAATDRATAEAVVAQHKEFRIV